MAVPSVAPDHELAAGDGDEDQIEELPVERISFFSDGEDHDLAVCTGVWRIYLRESAEHDPPFVTKAGQKREYVNALHADAAERYRRDQARRPAPAPSDAPEAVTDARPAKPKLFIPRSGRRKHAPASIGDVFGERTVIEVLPRGHQGRSDERVRWRCVCGVVGESFVYGLRANPRCRHRGTLTEERTSTMGVPGELSKRVEESHPRLAKKLGRAPTSVELYEDLGEDVGKNRSNVSECAKRLGLVLTPIRQRRDGDGKPASRKSAGGGPNPAKRKRPAANGHAKTNGHALARRVEDDDDKPPISGLEIQESMALIALQRERSKVAAELEAMDRLIERFHR